MASRCEPVPHLVAASSLIAAHNGIQRALENAWDAGISLLADPDDLERHAQCDVVAAFLRDAQLHIRTEDHDVFADASRAGVPVPLLEDLRGEHEQLCAAMAKVPPLLDRAETAERAALLVLRLVAQFERHLTHEKVIIAALAPSGESTSETASETRDH